MKHARISDWVRTRRYDEPSKDLVRSSLRQSCPDCIIATHGYSFREGQVSVVAKRHEISEQAIYTWRKRFGGFQANEVRRLKQLETENARLKKLVAERDLEIEIMKEVAAKNGERAGPSAASCV